MGRTVGADYISIRSGFEQNAQHTAQRLGGTPQQLVADDESRHVLGAHIELAHATHAHFQAAGGLTQICHKALRFRAARMGRRPMTTRKDEAHRGFPAPMQLKG